MALRDVLARTRASRTGLSVKEAVARRVRDGPNEIGDVKGRSNVDILLSQFKSVPVALLGGSAALSLATRARADAAAISAVLVANGALGFFTERHAEKTVSSLRKLAPGKAIVLRDGVQTSIASRDIVVGDVLVLKPGEAVAADARLIEAHRLSANESALTGESLPVRKAPHAGLPEGTALGSRSNMVHMGSVVSGGAGLAVVVGIAENSVLGAIRALSQKAEAPRTRMQGELDELAKRLGYGAAAVSAGIFALGLLRGRPTVPLLRSVVSLAVAAIPEGLPTVATTLLASGIRNMSKRNIYARRLDAIENLGAVDIACFDKTGTLTENRMKVAAVHGAHEHADWLRVCVLCNEVESGSVQGDWKGSATEIALIEFAASRGIDVHGMRGKQGRLAMKQRSEHHPYLVTLHADGQSAFVAVKGRPPEVLARCVEWRTADGVAPLSAAQRRLFMQANDELSRQGQRVLALASGRQRSRKLGETGGLTWLGLVGLADPERPGVAKTVERFRRAGIEPVMITGDQLGTARAVAARIGLTGKRTVLDASTLPENSAALSAEVGKAAGFARASPGMKLEIVKALQAKGHVVAMTGDGINDGPALRMADVGVSMGASATDFAHAMSDLVLQDDDPKALLDAIAEGRTAYLNVKKAVRYLAATNLSEVIVESVAAIANLPEPLDPIALLWTNLVTDVSPAIALGLEPPEPDILDRPPFARSRGLLDSREWRAVGLDGTIMAGATLASFLYALARYGPTPRARTMAFLTMSTSQLLYALSARSEAPLSMSGSGKLRDNPWLTGTIGASLALQAGTVLFPPLRRVLRTTPVSPGDALVVIGTSLTPLIAKEILKRLRASQARNRDDPAKPGRRT